MPPRPQPNTFLGTRLHALEARIDALDAGLRDVHPDYSRRILDRMSEMEQTCRSHVNEVLTVVDNQRQALKNMVTRAQRTGDEISDRLRQAGERHQADAKVLRQEIGQLKEAIDMAAAKQHEEIQAHENMVMTNLDRMERLAQQAMDALEQHEALDQKAQDKLELLAKLGKQTEEDVRQMRTMTFPLHQSRVIQRSRAPNLRTSSMPAILKEAQSVAKSRSPSREGAQAAAAQAVEPAQSVEPARGRSPAQVQAAATLSNAIAERYAATAGRAGIYPL